VDWVTQTEPAATTGALFTGSSPLFDSRLGPTDTRRRRPAGETENSFWCAAIQTPPTPAVPASCLAMAGRSFAAAMGWTRWPVSFHVRAPERM
jgi:hypothetical protein